MSQILYLRSSRTPDDEVTYNFGDLSNPSAPRAPRDLDLGEVTARPTKFDRAKHTYEFGLLGADDDEVIKKYLQKILTDAVSAACDKDIMWYEGVDAPTVTMPQIQVQWYFNYITNTAYLEYRFNKHVYSCGYLDYIKEMIIRINTFLKANFRYDIYIWYELINPEDGYNETVDSYEQLTPYTVGYWESLYGGYRFITDKMQILEAFLNVAKVKNPAFEAAKDQLYQNLYESDFDEFLKQLLGLYRQYGIHPDQRSTKSLREYFDKVAIIRKRYDNAYLSPEQKQAYYESYISIYTQYKDNPSVYTQKMAQLNNTYGIKAPRDEKIPPMFEEYAALFNTYFGHVLPEFGGFVYREFITLHPIQKIDYDPFHQH